MTAEAMNNAVADTEELGEFRDISNEESCLTTPFFIALIVFYCSTILLSSTVKTMVHHH